MMFSETEAKYLFELLNSMGDYRVGLNTRGRELKEKMVGKYDSAEIRDLNRSISDAHTAVSVAGHKIARLLNIELVQ